MEGTEVTHIRGRVRHTDDPEALASRLPQELRSFDSWYYEGGLRDYMRAMGQLVGDDRRVTPVMSAAGLSAADWFRAVLERGPQETTVTRA